MGIKIETTLEGDFVILRKVTLSDAQDIYNWRSGQSGRFLRHPKDYSLKTQEDWIKSRDDFKEMNYIIQDKKTLKGVGMISIYNIDEADGVIEVGRLLLDDEYLTKSNPYGLEALLITYDYVFNKLDFRKITGIIAAINSSMVKLQLFLGMKEEGYLKKHTLINGNFEDIHIISIFKDEFNNNYKKKIAFLLKNFK